MRRILIFIILIGTILLALPSCLTVEKKEYHFEFTGIETGVLTIKYVNIMSLMDDEKDVDADFKELLDTYMEGDLLEKEYRFSKLISKRLFEEEGVLCGELRFEFTEIMAARLFRYQKDGTIMMSLKGTSFSEEYESSNGNYGGDIMPVVFWSDENRKLEVTTKITKPDQSSISLLKKFKEWELYCSQ